MDSFFVYEFTNYLERNEYIMSKEYSIEYTSHTSKFEILRMIFSNCEKQIPLKNLESKRLWRFSAYFLVLSLAFIISKVCQYICSWEWTLDYESMISIMR